MARRWWSLETVAVVTGANRGLGLEIVRQLARNGVTTVLTSRDVQRGEEATQRLLLEEEGLPVVYHQLDVGDARSAQQLAHWLKQQYGGVDILINNAAILDAGDTSDLQTAQRMFNTNYYGVKNVTNAILPLLRPSEAGARIVNVSAKLGQLQMVTKESARRTLADVDKLSEQAIDDLVRDYYADVEEKKQSDWIPTYAANYSLSKACQNAYTRMLAKSFSERPAGQKIHVNAFCPGPTSTDMRAEYWRHLKATPRPYVTTDVAAGHAVWLTLLPANDIPSGILSSERGEMDFYEMVYA